MAMQLDMHHEPCKLARPRRSKDQLIPLRCFRLAIRKQPWGVGSHVAPRRVEYRTDRPLFARDLADQLVDHELRLDGQPDVLVSGESLNHADGLCVPCRNNGAPRSFRRARLHFDGVDVLSPRLGGDDREQRKRACPDVEDDLAGHRSGHCATVRLGARSVVAHAGIALGSVPCSVAARGVVIQRHQPRTIALRPHRRGRHRPSTGSARASPPPSPSRDFSSTPHYSAACARPQPLAKVGRRRRAATLECETRSPLILSRSPATPVSYLIIRRLLPLSRQTVHPRGRGRRGGRRATQRRSERDSPPPQNERNQGERAKERETAR
eukprot:scaffold13435_cov33-Tisochrysis_lutea.AAC.3